MAIYGIDLGTTYCAMAYVAEGRSAVVPLEGSGRTLASVVLYEQTAHGARVLVGKSARDAYRRLVGDADEAPSHLTLVRGAKNAIGVRTRVPGGPPWRVGSRELWATDVSATILRALAEHVRRVPGAPPMDGVVIAHPQRFRTREKQATAQAAAMAGLVVRGMVTEPDAAAWAYGLHDDLDSAGVQGGVKTFLVFDFGGGTLDVTVMQRVRDANNGVSIRALDSYGVQLGGLAIDEQVRDRLFEKYCEISGYEGLTLAQVNEGSREKLLETAEQLKIELNQDLRAEVSPWKRSRRKWIRMESSEIVGEDKQIEVDLGELSRWISGDIDRAVDCADQALARAQLQWGEIDRVLLTGGSSQLYAVQVRMQERAPGRVQVVFDDMDHPLNPQTIVATGAAMYGASLAGDRKALPMEIRGVLPDAFSVAAHVPDPTAPNGKRRVLRTLVPAQTPTPFTGRETFRLSGGPNVPVTLYEGRTEAEATLAGSYVFRFDQPLADGTLVEVALDVASNGLLTLRVRDGKTGEVREATLTEAGLYSDQELADRREWLRGVTLEVA
ncbi:MAG: Hsp70 family protein [Deltaproteobacteria bacterium]|nr:Hsp70 family protein [Deltaproteobacteria bacterium]